MARLTLNGMYEYEPTIFDGMILPEDYDKDALLFEILQRSGQLYPYHQQPPILKSAIRLWFARNYLNFDRTMEALMTEYAPLENYDRYEDWTRTPNLTDEDVHTGTDSTAHNGNDALVHTGQDVTANSGKDTTKHTGTDTTDHSGTDTTDHSGTDTTDHSGTDTTTHDYTDSDHYTEKMERGAGPHTTEEQVSAYDSGSYQPSKKTIEDWGAQPGDRTDEKSYDGKYKEDLKHGLKEELKHGHKEELKHGHKEELKHGHQEELEHGLTETTTRGTTDTQNYNSSEATTYGSTVTGRHTGTESYTAHMHGNIGVASSQELAWQEIELRKFDIYVDIASRFEHEFLVQVY